MDLTQLPYPNNVSCRDEFYISLNKVDASIYGCTTTALVIGDQMDCFIILDGDHYDEMRKIEHLKDAIDFCKTKTLNKMSEPIENARKMLKMAAL